jgi:hypothetical protein
MTFTPLPLRLEPSTNVAAAHEISPACMSATAADQRVGEAEDEMAILVIGGGMRFAGGIINMMPHVAIGWSAIGRARVEFR